MAQDASTADLFVEQQLHQRILKIEKLFSADTIAFDGPILIGVDDIFRTAIEAKHQKKPTRDNLVVLLTTTGGYIEVVKRIVDTLRRHYKLVDFVVPNHAYSAGTVLVMSGDAIHMDYYARLGPIDPQVETESGRMVSALGYLEKYERLIEKAQNGEITTAETQILVQRFDQGDLYQYEHSKKLSVDLLKEWLVRYKFKDWTETRTRKIPVTEQMKEERAALIAEKLSDTEKWHVHGHGISMEVLDKEVDLIIDDFGSHPELSAAIRSYHDLLTDYMGKLNTRGVVHFAGEYRPFM